VAIISKTVLDGNTRKTKSRAIARDLTKVCKFPKLSDRALEVEIQADPSNVFN
jgi:hypothetical protein